MNKYELPQEELVIQSKQLNLFSGDLEYIGIASFETGYRAAEGRLISLLEEKDRIIHQQEELYKLAAEAQALEIQALRKQLFDRNKYYY